MDPMKTAQKGTAAGLLAALGVGIEAAVTAYFGPILPAGTVTGIVATIGTAAINFWKHRKL